VLAVTCSTDGCPNKGIMRIVDDETLLSSTGVHCEVCASILNQMDGDQLPIPLAVVAEVTALPEPVFAEPSQPAPASTGPQAA
jgi:hypothetical protein